MKSQFLILAAFLLLTTQGVRSQPANIRLTDVSLMHESRDTPNPPDGWIETERAISFQWPMPVWARGKGAPLDGMEHTAKKVDKSKLKYRLRYSTDKTFPEASTVTVDREWPFYNPESMQPGQWFWQYAFIEEDGTEQWSPVYTFVFDPQPGFFNPPSYTQFISKLPATHPRILVDADGWNDFIENSLDKTERQWYLDVADKALNEPMKRIEDIRTDKLKSLTTTCRSKPT